MLQSVAQTDCVRLSNYSLCSRCDCICAFLQILELQVEDIFYKKDHVEMQVEKETADGHKPKRLKNQDHYCPLFLHF
jgi:hypothetical protein